MTTRPLPIKPAAAGWRHPIRLAGSLALLLPTCVSLAAVPPPLPPIRATEPPSTTQPPADPVDTISADAAARQGIGELMRSAHYWQAHYRPDITRSVLDKVLHVRADHAQALLLLFQLAEILAHVVLGNTETGVAHVRLDDHRERHH